MSSSRSALLVATLAFASLGAAAQGYAGIGRAATPKEIAAWDIDVRPDFKGLPAGAGSVAQGQQVWEAKCASCHGVFGESNEVFSPIVGGTGKADIETGRVARLRDESYPGRTTLMKLPTLSSLWDYIYRAMPWAQPKSLSVDEVYAVTAYLLNLGGVVADDHVLSDRNIAAAQARLPNRNGMRTDHGLWPGSGMGNGGRPDVKTAACMRNCATEPKVASFVPDYARDQHGNLADQNRLVGPQRGAVTQLAAAAPAAAGSRDGEATALLQKHGCLACHAVDARIVGPSLREVAARHSSKSDIVAYLAGRIRSGGQGVWGNIPMPPQTLSEADARAIASWLPGGAKAE